MKTQSPQLKSNEEKSQEALDALSESQKQTQPGVPEPSSNTDVEEPVKPVEVVKNPGRYSEDGEEVK